MINYFLIHFRIISPVRAVPWTCMQVVILEVIYTDSNLVDRYVAWWGNWTLDPFPRQCKLKKSLKCTKTGDDFPGDRGWCWPDILKTLKSMLSEILISLQHGAISMNHCIPSAEQNRSVWYHKMLHGEWLLWRAFRTKAGGKTCTHIIHIYVYVYITKKDMQQKNRRIRTNSREAWGPT